MRCVAYFAALLLPACGVIGEKIDDAIDATATETLDLTDTLDPTALDGSSGGGTCGDGIVGPDEECDDGNAIDVDQCTNACLFAMCGDGIVALAEQCDDGNEIDGDGCTDCRLSGSPVWIDRHDHASLANEGVDIAVTPDGRGYVSASIGGQGQLLRAYETDGDVAWTKVVFGIASAHLAVSDTDGLLVSAEESGGQWVRAHGSEGDVLWTLHLPGDRRVADATSDGERFYVVGSDWDPSLGWTRRVDAFEHGGALLWSDHHDDPLVEDIGAGVAVADDGSIGVVGTASDFGGSTTWIGQLAPDSTLSWSREYLPPWFAETAGLGAAASGGGTIFSAGWARVPNENEDTIETLVVGYHPDGAFAWSATWDHAPQAILEGATVGPDGSVIAVGHVGVGSELRALVLTYSPSGTLRWSSILETDSDAETAVDVDTDEDGYLYVVGRTLDATSGDDWDLAVWKLAP